MIVGKRLSKNTGKSGTAVTNESHAAASTVLTAHISCFNSHFSCYVPTCSCVPTTCTCVLPSCPSIPCLPSTCSCVHFTCCVHSHSGLPYFLFLTTAHTGDYSKLSWPFHSVPFCPSPITCTDVSPCPLSDFVYNSCNIYVHY